MAWMRLCDSEWVVYLPEASSSDRKATVRTISALLYGSFQVSTLRYFHIPWSVMPRLAIDTRAT